MILSFTLMALMIQTLNPYRPQFDKEVNVVGLYDYMIFTSNLIGRPVVLAYRDSGVSVLARIFIFGRFEF